MNKPRKRSSAWKQRLLVMIAVPPLKWRATWKFDSERWQKAKILEFKDATRKRMVDDLLERHPLVGRDQDFVLDLFGPADGDPYLLVEQPWHSDSWIYRLGPSWLDSWWLVIEWNSEGKVAEVHVLVD